MGNAKGRTLNQAYCEEEKPRKGRHCLQFGREELARDNILWEQVLYDLNDLGRELSYMAVSTSASTFRARRDLLPLGSGTRKSQRHPNGGLQGAMHDGIAERLRSVGPDRFGTVHGGIRAIEVTMLTLVISGR